MKDRPWAVVFTAGASGHVDVIQAWWTANREAAPALFRDELSGAIDRISRLPGTGAPFASQLPGVRRALLPRCRYHVYYTVHPARREVIVRAVWHAARGQGPDLGRPGAEH